MLERFYPGEYVDSTYEIDFDRLYEDGYRGVILILIIRWCRTERRRTSGRARFCTFEGAGISLHAAVEQ